MTENGKIVEYVVLIESGQCVQGEVLKVNRHSVKYEVLTDCGQITQNRILTEN